MSWKRRRIVGRIWLTGTLLLAWSSFSYVASSENPGVEGGERRPPYASEDLPSDTMVEETWHQYKARIDQERSKHRVQTGDKDLRAKGEKEIHSRQKRNIGFPTGSTFTITPVLCIPVVDKGDISGFLDIELPFRINLPNGTDYTHSFLGRKDEDRSGIYAVVIDALDRMGFKGKACLLRAICEISEAPLTHDGLIGEILNIILTVTSSGVSDPSLKEFAEAEYYGRAYGDCWSMYRDCPISLFRLIEG